jgi:hypothetical protein
VLKGYSAITSDSDDEVVQGALELTADASDGQVLSGKTYYNTNPKNKRTGTMTNQGTVSVKLNAGEGYMVPSGFHNGGGRIEANGLASQTGGTAAASHILNGKTAWVNGIKIDGSLVVQSIVSFNLAQYATQQIVASWALPATGPWSGIRIVCKQGGYPMHADDGVIFYEGCGSYHVGSLGVGLWYFRAWNYMTINFGREYGDYVNGTIHNNTITGTQIFTGSGIFTIPTNVYYIDIFCVGGGGGGAFGSKQKNNDGGGGGGGGYTATLKSVQVTPGQQLSIYIGAGGGQLSDGGDTYISGFLTAAGGRKGLVNTDGNGGAGGSGGGAGCFYYTGSGGSIPAGNGGANGANGEDGGSFGGRGQGTTTRAFGDPSGTIYAGGGGGGGSGQNSNSQRGYGGTGGGGNGSDAMGNVGSNGVAGTGGGGGGGYVYANPGDGYAGGSGIAIIRWG